MTLSLYTLHASPQPGEYIIQKFDTDYNVESVYALTLTECQCPQGHKPKCRHRQMLGMFIAHKHIGDGWFLQWENRMWRRPLQVVSDHLDETLARMGTNQTEFVEMLKDANDIAENMLADETVMGTSAGAEGLYGASLPAPGVEAASEMCDGPPAASPPSPPEGPQQPSQAAEETPVRPVGAGVIVKRRKIP